MKTVGIIGGLSPESTIKYYQWINDGVRQRLGKNHNAKTLISSVDFQKFIELKEKDDWDTQAELLSAEAVALQSAGADFIVLATNTMHKLSKQITDSIDIPFLHLADTTADRILDQGLKTVGLLGTKYTMELDFYKSRLEQKGIEAIVPKSEDRKIVSSVIYDELCQGIISNSSRENYKRIIEELGEKGAQGVVLGCTEITMLIGKEDCDIQLFDTTQIHVDRIVEEIFN